MPTLTHREFEAQLSLYVDGLLEEDARRAFESYLEATPEARRELDAYRKIQGMLSGQGKLTPNPSFWTSLSERLEERDQERENLLPFPRKYLPLAATVAGVAVLAVGVMLYGNRGTIFDFLNQTSQEVQTAIKQDLLQGSIVPLFAGLDRDHVLQYALFGTLPLDDESDRALRVDETSEQGYRIEMGKTLKDSAPRVTVDDFVAEVMPSEGQELVIDSLLDAAREQIESSAFYAENNAIAIDPELTKLNQATLVSIANVLRPDQRKRFDLFLKKHKSTYTVEARTHRDVPPPMPPIEWRSGVRTVGTAPRPFVVMTQDTCVYTQLELTAGHLELQQQELSRMRQVREENLGRLVERLRRTDEQREGRVRSDSEAIVVQGGTGYVSIQIHGALVTGLEDSAFQVVMRMPDQPKIFRHEIESPPGALNFEFSIKASGDLDSLVEAEMSRMREFQRHLVHEDSLLNARRRTPAAYPYSGDTVRSRRKF